MTNIKGKLIVVEGPDGSGKSTMLNKFKQSVCNDKDFVFIKEPSDTPIGKFARKWVHSTDSMEDAMSATEALYLFSASRIEVLKNVIIPSLNEGKIVISDRFALSTAVYQDLIPEWNMTKLVNSVLEDLSKHVKVDATFYMDIPAEEIVKRLRSRKQLENAVTDEFNDSREVAFYESLHLKYMCLLFGPSISKNLIGKVISLNALQSENKLFEDFKTEIDRLKNDG